VGSRICITDAEEKLMRLAAALLLAALTAAGNDWIASLEGKAETAPDGSIRALSFRRGWVSDADLDRIAQLDKLERLDLSETRVTDLGLLKLKELKNVRELNLFYAELVTDEGLATMRNWSKIERINARGTKVTDNTLALLAGKTTITALDIGFAEVTDSGLQHLSTLPNLRSLAVGGNKLTEVGLQVLRTLPQLESLDRFVDARYDRPRARPGGHRRRAARAEPERAGHHLAGAVEAETAGEAPTSRCARLQACRQRSRARSGRARVVALGGPPRYGVHGRRRGRAAPPAA
jgi:hypothetical protein